MMPNKKNPDPAELVRGRAARVIGALTGMLALLKGLPLAYQRDLQEDKPPLFDAVAATRRRSASWPGMVETLTVDRAGCARPPTRATRRPRPSPTRSSGAASRSGPPTTSSARSSPRPRRPACALDAVDDAMIGMALGVSGDPDAAALAAEPGIGDAAPGRRVDRRRARRLRRHRRHGPGPGRPRLAAARKRLAAKR